jgi:hypothetical protein
MSKTRVLKFLGFYVLQADEIGVRLTTGRYQGIANPGPGFAWPILQQVIKTKSSLQTIDLPDQQIVLSGNIAITISGSLNFRVADPEKALLRVDNYSHTVQQFALTTISDVLSTKTIEEVRTSKKTIAQEIEDIVAETASTWGLEGVDIRLTDARLDDSLLRAMMRETEAEKEAKASKIRAAADRDVARSYADAAETLAGSPGAMTLRILQTLGDLSNDKSTVVLPLPWDLLSEVVGRLRTPNSVVGGAAPAVQAQTGPPPSTEGVSQPAGKSVGNPEAPLCKLEYQAHRTLAVCPECDSKYNVTDVMGDMRYDKRPDILGLQIQCKRCLAVFTLPGSE